MSQSNLVLPMTRILAWLMPPLLIAVYAVARIPGVVGFTSGVVIAFLSVWSLSLFAQVLHPDTTNTATTNRMVVLSWILKLPVLLGVAYLVNRLGGGAIPCFLAGICLVYSSLVGAARRQ